MESGGGACKKTAAAVASAKAAATAEMKKKRRKNGGEGSRPPSSTPAGRHRQRLPARQKAMATAWTQAAMPTQPLISSARRASGKAWTSRAASTPTAYARSTPQTPAPNNLHATGKRPGAFPLPSSKLRPPAESIIPVHATQTGKTASAQAHPQQTRSMPPARQAGKLRSSPIFQSSYRILSKNAPPPGRREERRTKTRRYRPPPTSTARETPEAPQPANHRSRRQHQGHPDGQNSGSPPLRHIQAERRRSQGGKHQPAGQASSQGGKHPAGHSWTMPAYIPTPKGPRPHPGGGTEQQPYRPRKRAEPCDARRPCGKEGKNRANPPVKRHQEHAAPIPCGNSRQPQRNAGMPEPFCGFHPPAPASRRKGKQDGEGPAVYQHAVECEHEAAGRPRQRLLRHQTGSVRQRPQETQHESPCQPEQGRYSPGRRENRKKTAAVRFIMIRGNTLRTLSAPRKEKQQIRAIPPKSRTSGSHAFHADGSSPRPGPNIQHASSREPNSTPAHTAPKADGRRLNAGNSKIRKGSRS